MRLIINASLNYVGGGLQVALSFIQECIRMENHTYYVFASDNLFNQLTDKSFPNNFIFYRIPKLKFYQYNSYLSKLERKISPDVVFSIFSPVYWRPKSIHIAGFAMGHYLYPDSPLWRIVSWRYKTLWKLKKYIHGIYLRRDIDVFIVETNDTSSRLIQLYKKPCYVVSNTYSSDFDLFKRGRLEQKEILPNIKENEYRLLSVCSPYVHKNLSVIPSVIDRLNEKGYYNIKFVLTISEQIYLKLIPEKYRDAVINVGTVSSILLPQLYSECDAVFVPSLLECFTANFPEAMIMEKPILTSDLSFAHSICDVAALYFDPLDSDDIADNIIKLYVTPKIEKQLINEGKKRVLSFKTAQERANSYIKICSETVNHNHVCI